MKIPDKINRRRFASTLAASTALSLLPATALADSRNVSIAGDDHTLALGAKPEDLSEFDWAEVRARYANVLRVYGSRLSAEERHRIVGILKTNQHMLASIRAFDLQNGDASACTLRL